MVRRADRPRRLGRRSGQTLVAHRYPPRRLRIPLVGITGRSPGETSCARGQLSSARIWRPGFSGYSSAAAGGGAACRRKRRRGADRWRQQVGRIAAANRSGRGLMTVDAIMTTRSKIGDAPKRREDLRFVTGRGRYLDDIAFERLAHAVVLRSPHAHARITGIDARTARAAPGVLAVLTAADAAADGLSALRPGAETNTVTGEPF